MQHLCVTLALLSFLFNALIAGLVNRSCTLQLLQIFSKSFSYLFKCVGLNFRALSWVVLSKPVTQSYTAKLRQIFYITK